MNTEYKRILYINLATKEYEFKIHQDLRNYLGGIGVGYKLLLDNIDEASAIITCGPLSGYFPYISKACLLYTHANRLVEKFGGGVIAAKMNMAGIDGIVLIGNSPENLHISVFDQEVTIATETALALKDNQLDLALSKKIAHSDSYFNFGSLDGLELPLEGHVGINIDTSSSINMVGFYDYEKLYNTLLDDYKMLTVEPGNNPSCMGCPMGCDKSSKGEDDINVAILPRCLIACGYSEEIFKHIPTVYACLTSIGYTYHHSDLERVPSLVGEVRANINEVLNKYETIINS